VILVEQMAKLPVIPVPAGWEFQPVDAEEVADRVVELTLEGVPSGLVPQIAGPRIYELAELVRSYLQTQGRYRPILPMWLPGKAARIFRAGANLAPDEPLGRRTWEDFLAAPLTSPNQGALHNP
jgi:uncharacterized protein YbjT (DUF2867 family)